MKPSTELGDSGWIFDVKRFSIHDGPGIRTTVFLKGCPLRCLWCDNPESQQIEPQILFWKDRCLGCDACLDACPQSAIAVDARGRKTVLSDRCDLCGACLEACYAEALEQVGCLVTVEEIVSLVEADAPFYEQSGGGMTLSGGEPLAQPAFSRRLLEESRRRGIHTAVETCGHAPWEVWETLLPHLDLILYDLKTVDAAKHRRLTGLSNQLILENLRRLAQADGHVIIRRPVIPGCNDDPQGMHALARLVKKLNRVDEVHLLPYHRLGESKYQQLDREYPMGDQPSLGETDVEALRDILISYDLKVKIGG